MIPNNSISKRHDGLDLLRYLCSFLVICIHMPYLGKTYLEPLTRFAVPVFFMITGYFYSSIKQSNREHIQLKKTIILWIWSNLLYLIWLIIPSDTPSEPISAFFRSTMNLEAWIKFLFFNESFFSMHLWYLSALVYVLVIVLVFDKYSSREKLYKFIPFLLLINIIGGNYSLIIFGVRLPLLLTRNFLFFGLPFFLIGDVISQKQTKLTQSQLLLVAVFSVLLTAAENMVFLNTGNVFNADCFIGTPLLAFALFMLSLGNRSISNFPLLAKAAQLGKSSATIIYIIHPIVIPTIRTVVNTVGQRIPWLNIIWTYTAPLIILVLCTLFASCFNALQRKLKSFYR